MLFEDGGSANGVNISLFPYTEGDAGQKWYVYKTGMTTENTLHITSSATYTADMNFLASETDARGNTVSYTYNSLGQLQTVTNPKNVQTSYTYLENSNTVQSVTSAGRVVSYTYDGYDRLTEINVGAQGKYLFTYGPTGQQETVSVGRTVSNTTNTRLLSQTSYNSMGLPTTIAYGNGVTQARVYDNLGRLTQLKYGNTVVATYKYREDNGIGAILDELNGRTQYFEYDLAGRLVESTIKNTGGGAPILSFAAVYEDLTNRLSSYTVDTNVSSPITTGFIYGNKAQSQLPDGVYGVTRNGTRELTYTYDGLGRVTSRTLNVPGLATNYTYETNGHATTTLVKTYTQNGITYTYNYDAVGNITSIIPSQGNTEQYTYDNLNQLTRASVNGVVTDYTYDEYGNILTKKNVSTGETDTFTYGTSYWKDLLTYYNGQALVYDGVGNPLTYRDGITMSWQQGRQLATITQNGVTSAYVYDHNGNRLSKTVGGATTNYYVMDGTLYAMKLADGTVLTFFYDATGQAYGFTYGSTVYYYLHNLQGDITGIVDSSGNVVVSYTYDAWGKLLSTTGSLAATVGAANPFRYRGYIYDEETGFYYLQSRYYDPEICRFVNADGYVSTGQGVNGFNMFAYCGNNPVMYVDPTGESRLSALIDTIKKMVEVVFLLIDLKKMGFKNIDFKSASECYDALKIGEIDTVNEKAHFFAQCAMETNYGRYLTEYGSRDYFSKKKYGYLYRGSGYIQLTWDYNYKAFSEYMNDPEIYNKGADYVADNYAWTAAGWWWNNSKMNALIANGASVKDVTKRVRGGYGTWEKRQACYDTFLMILGG